MRPCGATKPIDGAAALVCTLAVGHALPHGVRLSPALPPYVVWPVAWTAADQARLVERHTWRKGHVRRPYQTLAMWKAGR